MKGEPPSCQRYLTLLLATLDRYQFQSRMLKDSFFNCVLQVLATCTSVYVHLVNSRPFESLNGFHVQSLNTIDICECCEKDQVQGLR